MELKGILKREAPCRTAFTAAATAGRDRGGTLIAPVAVVAPPLPPPAPLRPPSPPPSGPPAGPDTAATPQSREGAVAAAAAAGIAEASRHRASTTGSTSAASASCAPGAASGDGRCCGCRGAGATAAAELPSGDHPPPPRAASSCGGGGAAGPSSSPPPPLRSAIGRTAMYRAPRSARGVTRPCNGGGGRTTRARTRFKITRAGTAYECSNHWGRRLDLAAGQLIKPPVHRCPPFQIVTVVPQTGAMLDESHVRVRDAIERGVGVCAWGSSSSCSSGELQRFCNCVMGCHSHNTQG